MNPQEPISALPTASTIDAVQDYVPIVNFGLSETQKINRNVYLGITGSPVGTTDSQTLTNKTLTSPAIASPVLSGTVTGTYTLGGTPTFPSSVVTLTGSQTLTNKTLTAPVINNGSITGTTITTNAIVGQSVSTNGTVYGLSITGGTIAAAGLASDSVVTAKILDSAVTPAKLFTGTGSTWVWQSWVPTWTNVTIGNGTVVANYIQTGKTVNYYVKFTLGGSSAITGTIGLTMPTAMSTAYGNSDTQIDATINIIDNGTAQFYGTHTIATRTTMSVFVLNAASTYLTRTNTSSTVPMTWVSGDFLEISGTYQGA